MKAIILISAIAFHSFVFCQNAKSFYKSGVQLSNTGKYNEAIAELTKSLEIQNTYVDAYVERAKAYEKIKKPELAAQDYNQASQFSSDNEEILYNAGRLFFEIKDYKKATEKLERSVTVKPNYIPSYQLLAKVHIANGNIPNAKIVSEMALMKKNDADNNYVYGYTLFHLKDYVNAEKYFDIALKKDDKLLDAYYYLADLKLITGKNDEAMSFCNQGLKINQNDVKFYVLRSNVYKKKLELNNAINDISKAIVMSPENYEYYFIRGGYYKEFTQYQSAVSDYSRVIQIDPNYFEAYYQRARMFEEVYNYKAAIKDYQTILNIAGSDQKTLAMLEDAKIRLFELNRESNKPQISLLTPLPDDKMQVLVPNNIMEFSFKGQVSDESALKKLSLNGQDVTYTLVDEKPVFEAVLSTKDVKSVSVVATDVYDNETTKEYKILYTETDVPKVSIVAPNSSDNGEIYLLSTDPNLYIEGKIEDASKIQSIMIDGVVASYQPDQYNPTFTATISIQNKDKFTVKATDVFGNVSQSEIKVNKESANLNEENPMGKTWVIFIENSKYENYPSLDGPAKDVTSMRSALANYQVHNFIHKKDLTKAQLEKFFNIELRDLVRSNMVNSLLIWYAGHGKFINETGYWIPIDAKRDDEFSFFNIGNLKASMQLYSKYVTHLLLVTDACESGPTFYQAMRGIEDKKCDDWTATRFKSSQVFTSAGYELAVDNSQFTKTFATSLANNPTTCISIESIVNKVTKAVQDNNQQKPKFGKIAGLEDENGTFFFIAR